MFLHISVCSQGGSGSRPPRPDTPPDQPLGPDTPTTQTRHLPVTTKAGGTHPPGMFSC